MSMIIITFAYAVVMFLFGTLMYAISDSALTAFIPGFVGIVVAALAAVAMHKPVRMHLMHAIVALALLAAVLGLGMGLVQLGGEELNLLKIVDMLGMGLISVAYLVFAIRSFIAARQGAPDEV